MRTLILQEKVVSFALHLIPLLHKVAYFQKLFLLWSHPEKKCGISVPQLFTLGRIYGPFENKPPLLTTLALLTVLQGVDTVYVVFNLRPNAISFSYVFASLK